MATYVEKWVEEQARLAKPDKIYWCDGSSEEAQRLVEIGIKEERINGQPIFRELNHGNGPMPTGTSAIPPMWPEPKT